MPKQRYTFNKIGSSSALLVYNYGPYMKVQCNSSTGRTIVENEINDAHIEYQFDEIFGLGEYKKFYKKHSFHTKEVNANNPYSIKHTIVADYLPKLAKKDIKECLPEDKKDLIGKYFK